MAIWVTSFVIALPKETDDAIEALLKFSSYERIICNDFVEEVTLMTSDVRRANEPTPS